MTFLDPVTGAETLGADLISLISKVVPDPAQAAQLAAQIQQQIISSAQASDTAQATIDAAEAASNSIWSKPHLLGCYMCLFAIAFQVIVVPLAMWFSYAILQYPLPKPPNILSGGILTTLMYGLFGLSGVHVGGQIASSYIKKP